MVIRLQGLAAPESGELSAADATRAMQGLVEGETVRCDPDGASTHDRCVAICYLDGVDIAAAMVRAGVARDCPAFSGGRYAAAERAAATEGATIGEVYRLPGYCK